MLRLEEEIIVCLRQIAQAIDTYSRYLLTEFGLTAPQIATLHALQSRDSATPSELAEILHTSPATMAGILQRLEGKGLIERKRDSRDRRLISVRILPLGREEVAKAPPLLRDRFRKQLDQLQPWERTQILSTLQRVAAMMQVDDLEVAPFLFRELATAEPPMQAAPAERMLLPAGSESPGNPPSSCGTCPE